MIAVEMKLDSVDFPFVKTANTIKITVMLTILSFIFLAELLLNFLLLKTHFGHGLTELILSQYLSPSL